jgi:hypothetical protein
VAAGNESHSGVLDYLKLLNVARLGIREPNGCPKVENRLDKSFVGDDESLFIVPPRGAFIRFISFHQVNTLAAFAAHVGKMTFPAEHGVEQKSQTLKFWFNSTATPLIVTSGQALNSLFHEVERVT